MEHSHAQLANAKSGSNEIWTFCVRMYLLVSKRENGSNRMLIYLLTRKHEVIPIPVM